MTVITIILTVINACVLAAMCHSIGKQSVIDKLIKAYKEVCELNECDQIIIKSLQNRLKEYEKEEGHE